MSGISIFDTVRDASSRPDAIALSADGVTVTHRDLLRAAERVAEHLGQRPGPNEPVVAEVSNPIGSTVVTLGCDHAGVPVIHRDPAATGLPSGYLLHDGRARERTGADVDCGALLLRHIGDRADVLTGLPARSHVFFTSGSTGVPVGVVRTAEAVLADARRVAPTLDYAPDRPVVAAVPLFHVYGFNYALVGPLVAGASVRYCAARSVPSQLARVVRGHRAATLVALPAHYGLLAGTPDLLEPVWDERLGTLRKAVTAGAPLAPGVAATIAARFAFALYNCYGSSEAGAITLMRTIGGEERGDVGTPLPGIATRTVTTDVGLAAAELLLRSDSLAAGRLGPLGLVPLTDEDGWYRTGDLVDIGRPGGIRLVGRAGAVINVAGEKVSPAVIERVLADHPAVVDVQVVAAADVARGQVPLARVVLSDPSAAPALLGWCRGRLAPHEVPRQIDVVGELPRSATGKIITSTVTEERL